MLRKPVQPWKVLVAPLLLACIIAVLPCQSSADQSGEPPKTVTEPPKVAIPDVLKRAASTKISIDVKDADSNEIVSSVGGELLKATNRPININAMLRTYKVSLKVTDVPAEDVLRAVAALGHGSLYYSENGFVLAELRMIRPSERKHLVPAPLPPETSQAVKK